MSKRTFAVILAAGLIAGLMAAPADAQRRRQRPPQPVETTLFMHGESQFGEQDGVQWFVDDSPPESPLTLDAVEPDGGTKSMAIGSPVWNSNCTGLPLGYPTFTGDLTGKITGEATVIAHFQGVPATAVVRLWADVGAFQACNDDYIEPDAQVEFEAASGEVEIVLEDLDVEFESSIMIQILIEGRAAPNPRLQYDSDSALTRFEFECIPPRGEKACAEEPEGDEDE